MDFYYSLIDNEKCLVLNGYPLLETKLKICANCVLFHRDVNFVCANCVSFYRDVDINLKPGLVLNLEDDYIIVKSTAKMISKVEYINIRNKIVGHYKTDNDDKIQIKYEIETIDVLLGIFKTGSKEKIVLPAGLYGDGFIGRKWSPIYSGFYAWRIDWMAYFLELQNKAETTNTIALFPNNFDSRSMWKFLG